MDRFCPSFWSLDQNGEKLHYIKILNSNGEVKSLLPNPYYWLINEMIQFLLKEESIREEDFSHISKFINILFQKSALAPFATEEIVQAFYCGAWIKQANSELEKLKSIFNQPENLWKDIWFQKDQQMNRAN